MAQHRRALGAARPVAAGTVFAGCKRAAIRLRTGESVVAIGRVTDAGNHLAALGQRSLNAELIVVAVQVIDVLRHGFTFEILPRTIADTVTRIDGRFSV